MAMRMWRTIGVGVLLGLGSASAQAAFTLPQALAYPFVSDLTTDRAGQRIAWVRIVAGVRNIWVADAPGFAPRQVTQFTDDDGQELTQLSFSPDGRMLVFVRGGDHDANWPANGNLQPDPTSSPDEPKTMLWQADPSGTRPATKIVEGDAPVLSAKGQLAYVKDGAVWTAKLDGPDPAKSAARLFFDRGKDAHLVWSPDGSRLAFVSTRDDHSFIGVWRGAGEPLLWMAPTTSLDGDPVWSPNGARIAFTRQPGRGGAPDPLLETVAQPWAILVGDAATGAAKTVWTSGKGLRDSYPDVAGEANLKWAAQDRLTFLSAQTNWQQLYSVPAAGGAAKALTSGDFMVEHLSLSPDGRTLVYSANTGAGKDDDDRRHLFRVPTDGTATPVAVTSGDGLEWYPAALAKGVAFITAGAKSPPAVAIDDGRRRELAGQAPPADFAGSQFVVPRQVSWRAPDGLTIHGQLFQTAGAAKQPGVIFVHGGPPRQMMLGFSYMRYYSNAYAMNQYLAAHGFAVMSVNYRLGIGYGYDFQHPAKGGPAGASEYQDVLAGGRYLASLPGVDGSRIGIWGGSYGGLLTAQALGRNSDLFKAGVDLHGVHDWSRVLAEELPMPGRFEKGDYAAALETAFRSSPANDVAGWTSPVLFIHGDDDRNVRFNQTIDLVKRLQAKGGVDYEELVIPDEIHDFLRHHGWLTADTAAAEFLTRKLGAQP